MLKTGDTFERNGKVWRFLGLGVPDALQYFVTEFGEIGQGSTLQRAIVEEVVPEWIVPTDEHAKQRPECEVRDKETGLWWTKRTLLAVYESPAPFVTVTKGGALAQWRQCRIRNPEYKG
jgi:hypothetical protein